MDLRATFLGKEGQRERVNLKEGAPFTVFKAGVPVKVSTDQAKLLNSFKNYKGAPLYKISKAEKSEDSPEKENKKK